MMHTMLDKRLLIVGISLLAAGLACASPGGQATPAVSEQPTVEQSQPTATPYVVTATPEAAVQTTAVAPTAAQPTEQPAASGGRTISAGAKIAVFALYTIVAPADWADTRQVAEGVVDTLLLQKGGDTLMISQAAGGGGECIFGGTPAEMSQVFSMGVGVTGVSAQFMRGTNDGGLNWTVCEKGPDAFGFPTTFGYITYKSAGIIGDAALAEMDAMVATLAH